MQKLFRLAGKWFWIFIVSVFCTTCLHSQNTIAEWNFNSKGSPFFDPKSALTVIHNRRPLKIEDGAVFFNNYIEDSADYLSVKHDPVLTGYHKGNKGYSSYSIELDVKPLVLNGKVLLISKRDDKGKGIELYIDEEGKVVFYISGDKGSGMLKSKNAIIADSMWHKIAAVWVGEEDAYNFQIVVNGVVSWGTRLVGNLTPTTTDMTFGGAYTMVNRKYFYGWMDNIRLSNKRVDLLNLPGVVDLTPALATGKHLREQPGIMKYEFITDLPPTAECHAGTIVENSKGAILAAWFGGTREGHVDVNIWLSQMTDDSWSHPVRITDTHDFDSLYSYKSIFNPSLFQYPGGGPLLLFFLTGPLGSGYGNMKTSYDGGVTWTKARRLPKPIKGGDKNKCVLLKDGTLVCPNNLGAVPKMDFTRDYGQSWAEYAVVPDPENYGAIHPTILIHENQKLQILARTRAGAMVTSWSNDGGNTWTPLSKTSLPQNFSGFDAVTLSDGRHLLVYNHVSMEKGRWGGPRTPLNVAISNDGINWEAALLLEDEPGEYSYPAVSQSKDGMVHIIYTWNRVRMKYVKVDPSRLITKPIIDGIWP